MKPTNILLALALAVSTSSPGARTRPAWDWARALRGELSADYDDVGNPLLRLSYRADDTSSSLLRISMRERLTRRAVGLLVRVRSEEPTQIALRVREEDGESFFHLLVVPKNAWIERALLWTDFCRSPQSVHDDGVLDPARLSDEIELTDEPGFMREPHWNTLSLDVGFLVGGVAESASSLPAEASAPSSPLGDGGDGPRVDRIEGGWLGKAAGGALGLPVEMLSYRTIRERYGSLSFYLRPPCGFGPDDDTSYQVAALAELREKGPVLKASRLAEAYMRRIAPDYLWYGVRESLRRVRMGILPPASGHTPLGQCLGGQIRADLWGQLSPGDPERAARLAEVDASITDFGEGICGARFVAAAVSVAFVQKNVRSVIDKALAILPERCLYRRVVQDALAWHAQYEDPAAAYERLRDRYFEPIREKDPHQCWAYAIPNGGAVVLGLLYGEGDFERSLLLTAGFGWDADCNAATVGSILGTLHGARALPSKWINPLQDRLRCAVEGYEMCRISRIARWVAELASRHPELVPG